MTRTFTDADGLATFYIEREGFEWRILSPTGNLVASLPRRPTVTIRQAVADAWLAGRREGVEAGREKTLEILAKQIRSLDPDNEIFQH